ncbi:mevalonate kinase [Aerosakkonemataceae cyanobacterium BLCC-F50]|uniref:Mevalonate kinase n=1 Tax=Floridaenema flaviceps BLCC-F50 TaxID=3153642 RepID=A0ABV4Y006_9CYAN
MSELNLFVPGRLCLFGEHSDWAGAYPQFRETPGYCIAVGTNQGIYARVRQQENQLIVRSILPNNQQQSLFLPLESEQLLAEAKKGNFWSYVAGTFHEILHNYPINGLEIDCYRMDLPLKKGLSSSAAICVLVAQACNQIYNLNLAKQQEMDLAYRGETLTPSRCGRMDQICAFGQIPTFLTFDGKALEIEPIPLNGSFYYLIVDLKGRKDTVTILRDLNAQFCAEQGEFTQGIRRALGSLNQEITAQAKQALIAGNAEKIGELMKEAQEIFDRLIAPASPTELQAPKLHNLLNYSPIQNLIWGGKGVGSQGDGTAQLLTRSAEARTLTQSIIEKDLGLPCLNLTLQTKDK